MHTNLGGSNAGMGNTQNDYISYEEGLAMAKKVGALRYLECSAKLNKGVNEAFTEAARVVLTDDSKNKKNDESSSSCVIM